MSTHGPTGRVFRFRCLRCMSVLEAFSSQCGREARCPTCDAVFRVPEIDPASGLAIGNADPGEDGENPTPMHAYAAAGHKAPHIRRKDDDSLVIECPRCNRQSPITSDNCPECGLPFTLEGASARVTTRETRPGHLPLFLGIAALPLGFCGGVGIVPGVIAIILGCRVFFEDKTGQERNRAAAGVVLGLLTCVISVMIWTHI
jgi:hypothetical protein